MPLWTVFWLLSRHSGLRAIRSMVLNLFGLLHCSELLARYCVCDLIMSWSDKLWLWIGCVLSIEPKCPRFAVMLQELAHLYTPCICRICPIWLARPWNVWLAIIQCIIRLHSIIRSIIRIRNWISVCANTNLAVNPCSVLLTFHYKLPAGNGLNFRQMSLVA